MFELAHPLALLLLPLPWLVRYCLPNAKQQQYALWVPFYERLSAGGHSQFQAGQTSKLKLAFIIMTWIALVIAASGPQHLSKPIGTKRSGRDIMIAIDISRSMSLNDMRWQKRAATRIEIVKRLVGEFIDARKGDRIGLILFGTKAYLQAPLTYDRATISELLSDATIGLAGDRTAIGDAIGLGIKHLEHTPANNRILVLLTDGASNTGVDPKIATNLAVDAKLRIYTIGFGHDKVQINGVLGPRIISLPMDEAGLKDIAAKTNGVFFRAEDASGLKAVYKKLNRLEPVQNDESTFRFITPYYHYPLGLALILSLGLALLHYRSTPTLEVTTDD